MTPDVPFAPARLRLALFAAGLGLLGIAHAEDASRPFGLEFKATLESLDDRDLGTSHGGDLNGVGLDLRPWAFGQWGDWSAYSMGQAVAASDSVQTDTLQSDELTGGNRDNDRQGDDSYLALREFWVDYAGLTRYPGEHLRLGRQRLRETSGTWRDSNIEALQWTFDTTLLTSNLGVAQRFSDYRTDLDELAPQDRDRTHLFGDLSVQWLPRQHAILTLHHIDERGGLRDPGEVIDASDKRSNGNLTWVGVEANGDGYDHRSPLPLNYWASFVSLFGDRNHLTSTAVDGERVASGKRSEQVDAYAIDLGLRWNIDDNWRAGIAYARGSGGEERQFQQTGLESNRSSFTGTRARVSRFGEAFRGELANLQDLTLFGAWQLHDDYDLSLVYHRFRRVDGDADIGNSAIRAPLVNDSNDLGQEFDLVMTRYFKPGLLPFGTDEGSQVRLRGGLFQPGGAYGRQADSRMHHAFIDFIWHL